MSLVTIIKLGTLKRLPMISRRKVWMTSNHHAPYVLGFTRATMVRTKGSKPARGSKTQKTYLSSDWSLQLDFMKLESLVIANQNVAVNTFPGLVHTARHTTRVCNTQNRWGNRKEPADYGGTDDWGEVVTRYPYRKVGMDHLLSKERKSDKLYSVLRDYPQKQFFENWIL
jgi:hypothetical protein